MKLRTKTLVCTTVLALTALWAGLPQGTANAQPNCPAGTYPVPVGNAGLTAQRGFHCVPRAPAATTNSNVGSAYTHSMANGQLQAKPAWKNPPTYTNQQTLPQGWVGNTGQKKPAPATNVPLGQAYTHSMANGQLQAKPAWTNPPAQQPNANQAGQGFGLKWIGNARKTRP